MNADTERIVFEVKPNTTAYGYSATLFAGSIVMIGLLINELTNPPSRYSLSDKIVMDALFAMGALLLIMFAFLPIYKRVIVDEDSVTIKKFNRSVSINVDDICFLATETKYRIGKTIHMLVIRYGKKELILQDTFTCEFFTFQYYLLEFVNRSKCEVITM